MTTQIRILAWNVKKGERLKEAFTWITLQDPDVVLWQEMQPGTLHHIEAGIGMEGYAAARTPYSLNDNAIFMRPGGPLVFDTAHRHPGAPHHAPANICVRIRDPRGALSSRTVNLASEHSCYRSAATRLAEADFYTGLSKLDPATRQPWLTIVGGDWNSYARGEGPTDADWRRVTDPAFHTNRTYLADHGGRLTDDRPDRILTAAGYVDLARWAHDELQQRSALASTAGHGDERRQAGTWRIDRMYATRELTQALRRFRVGDRAETAHISDHLPHIATFDLAELVKIANRKPEQAATLQSSRAR